MQDPIGHVSRLRVRCACLNSFDNADMYLHHKQGCSVHQEKWNGVSSRTRSKRKDSGVLTGATNSDTVPDLVLALNPVKTTAKRIQCPCGRSFANDEALKKHLRYSKTHQVGSSGSGSKSKATARESMPSLVPCSPPALGELPGTIPSSLLVAAPFLICTCGHRFETQRILDLHKRDSLYHKLHPHKPPSRNSIQEDLLVSSFASLNLQTQARPRVTRFTCVCGATFTDQKALEHHNQIAAQFARRNERERRKREFVTFPLQFQQNG
jgi:hypothetical protein